MMRAGCEGDETDTAAGNVFANRGMKAGDVVYIVAVNSEKVYLIGRMKLKRIWRREEWDDDPERYRSDLWDGNEVIEGEDGTPLRFELTVPPNVLRELRFLDGKGREKGLDMSGDKLANPQSLRSVRRLTPLSARRLDRLL
jgi:hypothetical protein